MIFGLKFMTTYIIFYGYYVVFIINLDERRFQPYLVFNSKRENRIILAFLDH